MCITFVHFLQADAGGSPALVARGFSAAITAGSVEIEIPVPGDKVNLIRFSVYNIIISYFHY